MIDPVKFPLLGMLTKTLPHAREVKESRQLWTPRILRRAAKCEDCEDLLAVGAVAYGPVTNATNRWHRLCPPCARSLAVKVMTVREGPH